MERTKEPSELTHENIKDIWKCLDEYDSAFTKCLKDNCKMSLYEKWVDCNSEIRSIIGDFKQ